MNWVNLMFCLIASTGGFIASLYEPIASRMGLTVGHYFKKDGVLTTVGGIVVFGVAILSAFINPWWSIFIILISGWLLSQILISVFKAFAQMLALLLTVIGIVGIIVKLV